MRIVRASERASEIWCARALTWGYNNNPVRCSSLRSRKEESERYRVTRAVFNSSQTTDREKKRDKLIMSSETAAAGADDDAAAAAAVVEESRALRLLLLSNLLILGPSHRCFEAFDYTLSVHDDERVAYTVTI